MATQRVKIFGIIDGQGRYNASGFNDASGPDAMPWIADGMPDDSDQMTWRNFIIEADVEMPEATAITIEGKVT